MPNRAFPIFKSKEMDLVCTSCACDVANEKGIAISCISSGSGRMHYCIKWLPCKVSDIDFPLMVIKAIVSNGQVKPIDPEIRTFSLSSALRIFKFVIQKVKAETERPTVSRDVVQLCLSAILRFIKEICQDLSSRYNKNYSHDLLRITFQFVVIAREELGVLLLASPLYHVPLDLIYIKGGKSSKISSSPVVQTIVKSSVGYMDMVSPMIYTVFFLHLAVLVQSTLHLSEVEYMPLSTLSIV
ncbi:hypothetical protein KSP40_PGU019172 [Platanthera guangdongensis]|uniref:Uncharacterized protein n=1 Tax=Platanthera guangdongensis TaxID=2320717 RepID=A0ABR2MJ28_9ASPA